MEVTLTTWERIALYRILGETRGNVEIMEKCLELRALLKLDETEQDAANSKYGPGGLQFMGSPQEFEVVLEKEWPIEFSSTGRLSFLLNTGIGYNGWTGEDATRSVPLVHKLKKVLKELP